MKYIQIFLTICSALPGMIKGIESMFPEGGAGQQKLAIAKAMITEAYPDIASAMSSIEKIISLIVKTANDVGVFKNTPPAQ